MNASTGEATVATRENLSQLFEQIQAFLGDQHFDYEGPKGAFQGCRVETLALYEGSDDILIRVDAGNGVHRNANVHAQESSILTTVTFSADGQQLIIDSPDLGAKMTFTKAA